MRHENQTELLPFYFGTIGSDERIKTERRLLEEPDALIDYFDLKREMEAAETLPSAPSPRVWTRLSAKMRQSPRRAFLAVSVGLALAAGLAACVFFFSKSHSAVTHEKNERGILFDGGELSGGSGVL